MPMSVLGRHRRVISTDSSFARYPSFSPSIPPAPVLNVDFLDVWLDILRPISPWCRTGTPAAITFAAASSWINLETEAAEHRYGRRDFKRRPHTGLDQRLGTHSTKNPITPNARAIRTFEPRGFEPEGYSLRM